METPEEPNAMLQSVSPVNAQIAQQNHFARLQPPGLAGDGGAPGRWHPAVDGMAQPIQHRQDEPAPQQILAEEKRQIRPPMRSKEPLRSRGKEPLQRTEHHGEKTETQSGTDKEMEE